MNNEIGVRVALLADTHGEIDARIVAEVARCDYAVHAGDIGAAAVLCALVPRSGVVIAVRGNNDVPAKWPAADRPLLHTLTDEATLPLPGGLLAVGARPPRWRTRDAARRVAYALSRGARRGVWTQPSPYHRPLAYTVDHQSRRGGQDADIRRPVIGHHRCRCR